MLFGFPWWAWLVVFVLFWVLPAIAQNHFRQTVRNDLVGYIRRHYPKAIITEQAYEAMHLRLGEATVQLNMPEIYKAVAAQRPLTAASRNLVFAKFCVPFDSIEGDATVTYETHGGRVLPRLVDTAFLNTLPDRTLLPLRALGFTGLSVVYLLDSPYHVAYVTREQAGQMELDDRQLHEVALENLRARTDLASFEPGRSALMVFQNEDGHDPARLLLLPAVLSEEETLVGVISAPDTLILAPAPTGGDWHTWNALLQTDEAVGDRALKISHHGVEAAPLAND